MNNQTDRAAERRQRAYSISQAARAYAVCRNTLYRLGGEGLIQIRRIGRRTIISADELDKVLLGRDAA
ncbi:MAG: hypothetical protein KDI51_01435 [Xanthomonadales bacterium]|nr:hypothetical protein [Xanthomonadales bacterium]